ncbi:MAG: hypothetical protein II770_05895, partial [Bacteroidales bacterium]|nr:hypothetical protein [Bacteroidales bacterium]
MILSSLPLVAILATNPSPSLSPSLPWWRDMSITSLNAQTRRVESIWYPTEEEALSTPFEKSPNY